MSESESESEYMARIEREYVDRRWDVLKKALWLMERGMETLPTEQKLEYIGVKMEVFRAMHP